MSQSMYILILSTLYLLLPPTLSATATCVAKSASQLTWTSTNNKIYLNGEEFKMKGLSWFGFETDTYIPHGLASWANGGNSYTNLLDWITEKGFNAIRLPFSQDMVNSQSVINDWQIDASGNSIFSGKTPLEAMDIIIDAAAERGILIMLDFHSKSANAYTQGMNDIGLSSARDTWITLAQRYKSKWNIYMADMYNEAHDVGNEGEGTTYTWIDYIEWIEVMSNALIDEGVNWLFGVQGTNSNCNLRQYTDKYCYWGENLQGVSPFNGEGKTVELSVANRFVWLPHVYSPEISNNGGYSADIWKDHWGFLCDGSTDNGAACIIGEFGTTLSSTTWLSTLVEYLITIDSRNTYFWCLNPDSGDTGGLLQADWHSDETQKLQYLSQLQPTPTSIIVDTQICVQFTGESLPSSTSTTSTSTTSTSSGGGSIEGRIKVSNQEGANMWWYAVVLSEIASDVTISTVKVKGSGMITWEIGVEASWHSNTYIFENSKPYAAPFSFAISSSSGAEITSYDVIATLTAGDNPDYGYMSAGSAFSEEAEVEDDIHWTAIFAIVAVVMCVLGAVIGAVWHFKRKKSVDLDLQDTPPPHDNIGDTVVDKDGKDGKGYDMSPLNKNENEDGDQEELEIEMEVELETR